MKNGDGLVLWSASDGAGICAPGEIDSEVAERPTEDYAVTSPAESALRALARGDSYERTRRPRRETGVAY